MANFVVVKDGWYFKMIVDGQRFEIDSDQYEKCKNIKWKCDGKFIYYTDSNNKRRSLINFLFNIPEDQYIWSFVDGRPCNIRSENVGYQQKLNLNIDFPPDIEILQSFPGHIPVMGVDAGKIKNPHWLVRNKNKPDEEDFYMMYCEPGVFTYFSQESYEIIQLPRESTRTPTWFYSQCGYVAGHIGSTNIYMHQIVMDFYNHGSKTESIDHINRDKLDNRIHNLRIVDQATQNRNTGKRNRKHNARPLPDGIQQSDMPKYVTYNKETYNKSTGATRDYFRIEKHPAQGNATWTTSKSNKLTIQQKLDQAKEKLEELNALVESSDEDESDDE